MLRYVKVYDDCIEIGLRETGDSQLPVKILETWLRKEAVIYLKNMFYNILSKYKDYGFTPSGLSFRKLKSRWGSCSSKGKITLNTELIKLDPVYSEYVILHELCHLRHHNHGKEYYLLLSELCPAYLQLRKELRKFTTR